VIDVADDDDIEAFLRFGLVVLCHMVTHAMELSLPNFV